MKALFVYTGSFYKDKNGNIADKVINYNMILRYKDFFDEIIVAGRYSMKSELKSNEEDLVEGTGVSFFELIEKKNKFSIILNKRLICNKLDKQIECVDVVIARVPSEISNWAIEIANKKGIPVITEVVACPFDTYFFHGSIWGKFYAPIAGIKMKRKLKEVKNAIYVTESFLQKRYPNADRSYSCSDVEIKRNESNNISNVQINKKNSEVLLKRINKINNTYDNSKIILGMMGSLDVKFKGHKVALKAVRELVNNGFDCVIKFAGEGNKESWIALVQKLGLQEHVEFCGWLSKNEVEKWLEDIDIYIQPSKTEGLSRAVIEAMSYGCPVIASNVGGMPEVVEKSYLINPNDYKKLAQKILLLANDKKLQELQATRNFKKAEKYSYNKLQEKRKKVFEKFVKEISR